MGEFGLNAEAFASDPEQVDHAEVDTLFAGLSETDTQRSSFMDDPSLDSGRWGPPILAGKDPTFPYESGEAVKAWPEPGTNNYYVE